MLRAYATDELGLVKGVPSFRTTNAALTRLY